MSTLPRNDADQVLHAGPYKMQGKGKVSSSGQRQKQGYHREPHDRGKEHSERQRRETDGKDPEIQRVHSSEETLTDQQLQKFQRGRYKCSRCGALKVSRESYLKSLSLMNMAFILSVLILD